MADHTLDHTFCGTRNSLKAAVAVLKTSNVLAFDCEGQDLGTTNGRLSLVALNTMQGPSINKTFIIDILKLPSNALRPIYDILQSDAILKVVFDGRKDYSSLYHDFHVELRNVVDIQLVDVKSRVVRGERKAQQMKRLQQVVHKNQLTDNQHRRYEKIHKLNGLKSAAKEHGITLPEHKGQKFDHSHWLDRPLPVEYLQHVIEDVLLIQMLYNRFRGTGYLYSQIVDDSSHYVTIWKDSKPASSDIYRNHGLLPLNIIDHCPIEQGSSDQCMSCLRILPRACFSEGSWHAATKRCLVCWVVKRLPARKGSKLLERRKGSKWLKGRK